MQVSVSLVTKMSLVIQMPSFVPQVLCLFRVGAHLGSDMEVKGQLEGVSSLLLCESTLVVSYAGRRLYTDLRRKTLNVPFGGAWLGTAVVLLCDCLCAPAAKSAHGTLHSIHLLLFISLLSAQDTHSSGTGKSGMFLCYLL